jgi:non-heme chloroperoxidase
MPRLSIDDGIGAPVQLSYEDRGHGRPVVLVPGWPLSRLSWEAQIPALIDAGHRVIAYDRRGFGASSQPWSGYDYDTFADDLRHLLDHLDVADATLVGFSAGGGEVARYIGRHGTGRVAQAVFVSTVTPYAHRTTLHPEGFLDDAFIADQRGDIDRNRVEFVHRFATRFLAVGGRPETISPDRRSRVATTAASASLKATNETLTALATTDFREDLKCVTVPTLVVHGEADSISPLAATGQRTADTVSGSRLVVIDEAPHGLIVTHAGRFNAELSAFLHG